MKKILLTVLFIFLIEGCSQKTVVHNVTLEEHILSTLEDGDEIDLNELTDFTWDTAYLFTPYTTQESINKHLGVTFKDPSNIDHRDDIFLLIFMEGGDVIQYAEISREHGDLSVVDGMEIKPEKAMLKVEN
ncbi:hypothetical protein [Pseudalkalibacillus sp. SCS-8]|uniref:hypothetical protein n=1 Tax=Pseudalkalibacillus nanhaiensis TaxID=3115291 RepID=UPI0032D9FA1D